MFKLADRVFGLVNAVKDLTFMVNLRFGRVEVFGLVLVGF